MRDLGVGCPPWVIEWYVHYSWTGGVSYSYIVWKLQGLCLKTRSTACLSLTLKRIFYPEGPPILDAGLKVTFIMGKFSKLKPSDFEKEENSVPRRVVTLSVQSDALLRLSTPFLS